jgi:diacylglycerol kinase family enzyme
MRITLMHNPKAGDAEHVEKQLMTAVAKAGHHATYQSSKKSDYKKGLKKPTDLVLAAGGIVETSPRRQTLAAQKTGIETAQGN